MACYPTHIFWYLVLTWHEGIKGKRVFHKNRLAPNRHLYICPPDHVQRTDLAVDDKIHANQLAPDASLCVTIFHFKIKTLLLNPLLFLYLNHAIRFGEIASLAQPTWICHHAYAEPSREPKGRRAPLNTDSSV